ncbi:hypothetical protein GM418_20850 [Maribellus comscasis]|uniref:Signal transduction histidine kinase internal region domain-containing protein n=1 Tax=Maribellus comscasis TaxID=2681766 RepID=A0A6I6JXF5_9BACT|nr:histidine kinase [Maribellus comscasis]QGY46029.1 hypothetical protein GM418_20850 [Maribellus comscasis]
MSFTTVNQLFPFRKLLNFLLGISVGVQLVIILYNHYSGYAIIEGATHFLIRLSFGSLLSLVGGFMLAYPNLFLIHFLNKKLSWHKKIFLRITVQFLFAFLLAVFISIFVTLISNAVSPFTNDDLNSILFYNALITVGVNILMMISLEAWLYFNESNRSKIKAENLERELSQIKFEVLKSQINPHFMFNSLNVLSGLIDKDVKKAQRFIDEFSMIYRYVLETIEKPVVSLNEELKFIRSYISLQQMRYDNSLYLDVDLPGEFLKTYLPPLSLQVTIENAIKHNIVNTSNPLKIELCVKDKWLVVRNNLQPKISSGGSTGLGQKNMIKRYAMISEQTPKFMVKTNFYEVELPLIKPEEI